MGVIAPFRAWAIGWNLLFIVTWSVAFELFGRIVECELHGGKLALMTERRTLLGALWDRQRTLALPNTVDPTKASPTTFLSPQRLAALPWSPDLEVDTRKRGEDTNGGPMTAVRGEGLGPRRPRLTRGRGGLVSL